MKFDYEIFDNSRPIEDGVIEFDSMEKMEAWADEIRNRVGEQGQKWCSVAMSPQYEHAAPSDPEDLIHRIDTLSEELRDDPAEFMKQVDALISTHYGN